MRGGKRPFAHHILALKTAVFAFFHPIFRPPTHRTYCGQRFSSQPQHTD
jgi:hypothetical protein